MLYDEIAPTCYVFSLELRQTKNQQCDIDGDDIDELPLLLAHCILISIHISYMLHKLQCKSVTRRGSFGTSIGLPKK